MKNSEPKSLNQFARWLEHAIEEVDFLCQYVDLNYFDQLEITQTAQTATRLACRFGAGELVVKQQAIFLPLEALSILGRLLKWAQKQIEKPTGLLNDKEVANLLGVSSRTV